MGRHLLSMIIGRFVPDGRIVIGMDDTIERRRGRRISARGIYRDPVRSSHGHFVKASEPRWLSFMVLTPVPRAGCIKALPMLTLLAPSERADHKRGRRHKLLTDWARQGALQLCRRLPDRDIVFVGDSSFAVHGLAHALNGRTTPISRLRLDANLFAPPPAGQAEDSALQTQDAMRRITVSSWWGRQTQIALAITSETALWYRRGTPPRPIRWVLVSDPEEKRAPQAFFSTDTTLDPAEILALFVRRWPVEVTFAETRAHLGLYSLIALWACDLMTKSTVPYAAAWYRKTNLTFTDAIGAVRHTLWVGDLYRHSPLRRERQKISMDRLTRMAEALCFAA